MHRTDDGGPWDPWVELTVHWPEIDVVLEPMAGTLLGELRYPVIALRADSSAAQQRCTLAHELVHLERGTADCGPWAMREEVLVHAEAARRLIGPDDLARALREVAGVGDLRSLARALDVDLHTARVRVGLLSPSQLRRLRAGLAGELWDVA